MSSEKSNHGDKFFNRLLELQGDMTISQFCRAIGISTPLYQKWKNGSIPGYNKLRLISQKFNRTPEWILGQETFGSRLRSAREASGLTLEKFADKFEGLYTPDQISKVELDIHPPSSDGFIRQCAIILGVSEKWLKDGELISKGVLPVKCSECENKEALIKKQQEHINRLERIIDKLTK